MARTIRGGQMKSMKDVRAAMKKASGGAGYLTRIPKDGSVTVRFLTEPDGWVNFYEHYDEVLKFYPCTDDCPGCSEGDNPSQRYLTNAVDVDENKVIPLLLPKTAAASVLKKYDKYGTLLDRDYEIARDDSGERTEYEAIPEPPQKMNLDRFEELDLWALVEAQLPSEDDEDDEDERPRGRSKKGGSRKGSGSSRRPARSRRDEDDDDDDDDEDEDERPARRRPAKKTAAKRTAPARKGAASGRTAKKTTRSLKRR